MCKGKTAVPYTRSIDDACGSANTRAANLRTTYVTITGRQNGRVMKITLLAACLLFCTVQVNAQDAEPESSHASHVPVLSGGMGYIYNVNGGTSTLQPAINPVLLVPIGSHLLGESRAGFVGVFQRRNGNGDQC